MCVMSSVEMAARWDGLEEYRGLRDWCANEAGGAYPGDLEPTVDRGLARDCSAFDEHNYLSRSGVMD